VKQWHRTWPAASVATTARGPQDILLCSRYSLTGNLLALCRRFGLKRGCKLQLHFNLAPIQFAPVMRRWINRGRRESFETFAIATTAANGSPSDDPRANAAILGRDVRATWTAKNAAKGQIASEAFCRHDFRLPGNQLCRQPDE
jgi:hypothetical protein